MHSHKAGDVVTIFQMHPRRGLEIEGEATIAKPVPGVDEQYVVVFRKTRAGETPGEQYERFVDREGQQDPTRYVRYFNARIGMDNG